MSSQYLSTRNIDDFEGVLRSREPNQRLYALVLLLIVKQKIYSENIAIILTDSTTLEEPNQSEGHKPWPHKVTRCCNTCRGMTLVP